MRNKFALPALLAALALAGCAGRERVGFAVAAGGPDYYDGYYDGYYGPFVDGYWGGDGVFWYQDGGHAWHSDGGSHFRHAGGSGVITSTVPAPTGSIKDGRRKLPGSFRRSKPQSPAR